MGAVYLLRHVELPDVLKVLKVIAPWALEGPSPNDGTDTRRLVEFRRSFLVERFEQEAAAISRLSHPNIVPIDGIGTVNGQRCMLMPYLIGKSLEDLIQERGGRLAPQEVLHIAAQIAKAMDGRKLAQNVQHGCRLADVGRSLQPDRDLARFSQKQRPYIRSQCRGRSSRGVAMRAVLGCVVLVVCFLSAVGRVWAGPLARPTNPEARAHLDRGNKLYDLGKFQDAIVEYEAGALIEPAAVFDYNLGQANRLWSLEGSEIDWQLAGFIGHQAARGRTMAERRARVERQGLLTAYHSAYRH